MKKTIVCSVSLVSCVLQHTTYVTFTYLVDHHIKQFLDDRYGD